MFTDGEQIDRVLEVLRDAFDGHPAMMELGDPNEGAWWVGEIPGPPKVEVRFLPQRYKIPATAEAHWDGGHQVQNLWTYHDLCEWAFEVSRMLGLQKWVTPRHFCHLVNLVLEPERPLPYNGSHPHDHELNLPGCWRLTFCWHVGVGRVSATLYGGEVADANTIKLTVADSRSFQSAGDALGWLTFIKNQIDGTAG